LNRSSFKTPKDRRVRSNAEREREHGHGREAGTLEQLTEGVAKVVKHDMQETSGFLDVPSGSELRWAALGDNSFTNPA